MPKTPRGPYKKKKQEEIFAVHEIKTEKGNLVISDEIITGSKSIEINPNPDENKAFIIDYIEEKLIEESNAVKPDNAPQITTAYQEFAATEFVTQPVFNLVPASNGTYTWNQTETIVFQTEENYENNPFDDADDAVYTDDDEKPNDITDNYITAELVNVKMETDNEEGECSPGVKLKVSNTNSDKRRKRKGSRSNDKRGKENSSDEEDDYRKVVYEYESSIR